MKVKVNKIDSANASINASMSKEYIAKQAEKAALEASKSMKVDGFRQGKVPVAVVKARFADKLTQDAESKGLQELLEIALQELGIHNKDVIGEPQVVKFDRKDGMVEAVVELSLRPKFELKGYEKVIPAVKEPKVTKKEVEDRIAELAVAQAPFEEIKTKRGLKKEDTAVFDFEGFLDGVPFDGGKAEGFSLKIGSGNFIPGFEDQMIGMKKGEEKTIKVTFPENYQAANLAGKETEFKLKLHKIETKSAPVVDDELAKKMLPGVEDANLEKLHAKIEEQIKSEKMSEIYNKELKPQLVEKLIEFYTFDLPKSIVEQEMDVALNNKARTMTQEEIEAVKADANKLKELRESLREEASKSVKLTFIVDDLARELGISVNDMEVQTAIYYEAIQYGQDPSQTLKYYQDNNLLPIIKLSMIEDKLMSSLLDTKLKGK